jgi:hypothetical protein
MVNSFGINSFVWLLKTPRRPRVTTLADCEVIAAKHTLAVMASHAALTATCRVMVKRFRRSDLASLRHSRSNLVTFVAGYFLMFGMIESHAECLGGFRSPGIPTQLMTRTTGRDIAATGLRARSVASKTSGVRIESRGYREGNAATRRSMTRRTTDTSHLNMQRVIELHAKALQTWKRFQGS